MATNPYVNKVEYSGQTIIDLTGDTVTPSDVMSGVTFHDRSGAPQTGSMITHNVYDGLDSTSTTDALSANQGKVLNTKVTKVDTAVIQFSLKETDGGALVNIAVLPSGFTMYNSTADLKCYKYDHAYGTESFMKAYSVGVMLNSHYVVVQYEESYKVPSRSFNRPCEIILRRYA